MTLSRWSELMIKALRTESGLPTCLPVLPMKKGPPSAFNRFPSSIHLGSTAFQALSPPFSFSSCDRGMPNLAARVRSKYSADAGLTTVRGILGIKTGPSGATHCDASSSTFFSIGESRCSEGKGCSCSSTSAIFRESITYLSAIRMVGLVYAVAGGSLGGMPNDLKVGAISGYSSHSVL